MKRNGLSGSIRRMGIAATMMALAGCTSAADNGTDAGAGADMPAGFNDDMAVPIHDLAFECTTLACKQVNCGELNPPTTLTGTVYAPNGTLPIFNAIVYIPDAPLDPIPSGLSCDRCDGHVSGKPLVLAQTGPSGKFTLENVPAGDDIPLVIQIGKWRRQVRVPNVPACSITTVSKGLTRLPKNRKEGSIPQIAVSTGSADPMECLLLKMGIDPKEIQNPGNGARIEMYQAPGAPGTKIDANTPKADDPVKGLYVTFKQIKFYDIVLLPCEGRELNQSVGTKNVVDYVNAGGRVFATHFSYDWLTYPDSPFNQISKPLWDNGGFLGWHKAQSPKETTTVANLVADFPKGKAFISWLKAAGAQSVQGTLNISDIRKDIDSVDKKLAQPWALDNLSDFQGNPLPQGTPQLTFNTPLDAGVDDAGVRQFCGRVVYSDFHVAVSEVNPGQPFPGACKLLPMTDQEKALAFMIFDLSSCVQPDVEMPIP